MKNITISDSFNFNRFLMLLKRYVVSNKRLLIMELAVVAGLILMAEVTISWACSPNNELTSYNPQVESIIIGIVGLIGFSFYVNIASSLICSGLTNKKGRVDNLMAVGTPAEKYLVCFFIYNVFAVVYFLTVWIGIDYLRVLYFNLRYSVEAISVVSLLFKTPWQLVVLVIASLLFSQAFYTLVSAFSPKWAFLKGFGLTYALNFLAVPYCMMFSFMFFDINPSIDYVIIVSSSIALLFIIAMQYLAYFRYTETDII